MNTCTSCAALLPADCGEMINYDPDGNGGDWHCALCLPAPTTALYVEALSLALDAALEDGAFSPWIDAASDRLRALKSPRYHSCSRLCDAATGWHEEVA